MGVSDGVTLMARAADDLSVPVVDFIDDGLTDDERADAPDAWLAEL
jgi:hypothetical protein